MFRTRDNRPVCQWVARTASILQVGDQAAEQLFPAAQKRTCMRDFNPVEQLIESDTRQFLVDKVFRRKPEPKGFIDRRQTILRDIRHRRRQDTDPMGEGVVDLVLNPTRLSNAIALQQEQKCLVCEILRKPTLKVGAWRYRESVEEHIELPFL